MAFTWESEEKMTNSMQRDLAQSLVPGGEHEQLVCVHAMAGEMAWWEKCFLHNQEELSLGL